MFLIQIVKVLDFEVKQILFKKDKSAFSSVHWGILESDSVGGAVDVLYFLLQNISGLRCPSAFVPILHCFSSVIFFLLWFFEE